ncbi:MAG: hypothetical protein ACI814_004543 [Mariniblastus sp.]
MHKRDFVRTTEGLPTTPQMKRNTSNNQLILPTVMSVTNLTTRTDGDFTRYVDASERVTRLERIVDERCSELSAGLSPNSRKEAGRTCGDFNHPLRTCY